MTRAEIRAVAREDLGGKLFGSTWLMALVLSLLYSLVIGVAGCICGLGELIVLGPMTVGLYAVLLDLSRTGKPIEIGRMFEEGFSKDFGRALLIGLMKCIFICLWMFLFFIPGIVKSYSYAFAEFIAIDNPHYSWKECIDESRRLMDGHKMELFLLDLSFIGWAIICGFTFGIGYLWLAPYINQSRTVFYRSIVDGAVDYDEYNEIEGGYDFDSEKTDPVNGWAYAKELPATGCLHCVTGEMEGAEIPMNSGDSIVIGRDPATANIVITNDSAVSRQHCVVQYNGDSYTITDFSKNGVALDDGTVLKQNLPFTIYPGTIFKLSKNTSFMVK